MARRKKSVAARSRQEPRPSATVSEKYGMELSRQRLEKTGFHPEVTEMNAGEIIESWRQMARKQLHEPRNAAMRATRVRGFHV